MKNATSDQHTPPGSVGPQRLTPAVLLATGLGVGFSPVMPGTVGSLLGLPLAWALGQIPSVGGLPAAVLQAAAIFFLAGVGVPLCTGAGKQFGKKDPSAIVWDEIAALPIVFWLVPADQLNRPLVLAAGFLLFRLFDISKLPPIKRLERLPAGLGVMADDWLAALYAAVSLQLLLWLEM